MPKIQLRYLAPTCDIAGTYRETISVDEGSTMMDVIAALCQRYGSPIRELFYDSSGTFRPMFIIVRNAKPMQLEEMTEPLSDGDTCVFVPPIAGGWAGCEYLSKDRGLDHPLASAGKSGARVWHGGFPSGY